MIFKTGMNGMRLLFWLVFWLAVVLAAFPLDALDRDAFTFTSYSLQASLRPAEHEFEASGTIELRNDSNSPQKEVPLQISSSLAWKKIQLEGHQPVAYIRRATPPTSTIPERWKRPSSPCRKRWLPARR